MGISNKPKLDTYTINKQDVKTEVARGFVLAFGLSAMLFYFILFPAPFREAKTVTRVISDTTTAVTEGEGSQEPTNLQYEELSSCVTVDYSIISPINHGRRTNSNSLDQISYIVDDGTSQKLWAMNFLDCGNHGANMPKTLSGQRQDNVTASTTIGNITGTNSYNEVVVSTQNTVEAYDLVGNEKWVWTPEGNETVDFAPPILTDFHITPEGLEVLASGHEGTSLHLYYLDGATGELMSPTAHQTISNVSSKNPVSVSDLTVDYTPDVIVAADDTLYVLNNIGQLESSFDLPSSSLHTPPMALSENNPRNGYIFIGYNEGSQTKVYGWDHHLNTGSSDYSLNLLDADYPYWDTNHQDTYSWPITVNGNLNLDDSQTLAFANLTETVNPATGTENPDIVFVTDNNKLHGYSHFGEHLFTSNIGEAVNGNSQPVAFDYDNDGYDEIFVATSTYIYAYETDGSLIDNLIFPMHINESPYWGPNSVLSGALTIVYNDQFNWPVYSIPVDFTNSSTAWQFSVRVEGEDYSQPSFTGPGGSIHNTNSYNICRISDHEAAVGSCDESFGTSSSNSYCTGGTFVSNCYLCGCPSNFGCPGVENNCFYNGGNGPIYDDCGGSPVMLKQFVDCVVLDGDGGI
ncbi:hypothetical protein KKG41_06975 [Patescibacteria group bacterium]|nr:hypothetical protein [Patescibacteria group bacterium]